jgi:two-component system, cell cycle response regulator
VITNVPFSVLVADDDDVSRKRLESVLRKHHYTVVSARDGQEAWDALEQPDAPRLTILDWMMPGMDGAEICRRLRATKREPYTYVMLLTGKDAKADLVEGLESGADDYLTKPFNTQELEVRLRAGRRIVELQRELITAREEMRYLAMHDRLTTLYNRTAMDEVLTREVGRSLRSGAPLSVAMIDLDFFKKVNDTFGHAGGDAVLQQAAQRFKHAARVYDVVGRFGGEEFCAVFPACDAEGASVVAERFRAALEASPVMFGKHSIPVTCSVGVCTALVGHEFDARALLVSADRGLYDAKHSGRNRVVSTKVDVSSDAVTSPPQSDSMRPLSNEMSLALSV